MPGKSPNKKKQTTRKNPESEKQQIQAPLKEVSRRKLLKVKGKKKRKTGKRVKGKEYDNSDNINDFFHPDIGKSKHSITLTELNELLNKAKPLTDKNKIYQESEKQQYIAHLHLFTFQTPIIYKSIFINNYL